MKVEKIVIIGAGPYAVNIKEIISQTASPTGEKREVLGYLDEDESKHGEVLHGSKVLGGLDWLSETDDRVGVVSVINPSDRERTLEHARSYNTTHFPNLIHPSAVISPRAEIGEGNVIAQGAIIGPEVKIGDFNKINYNVTVGHHCEIGSYNTLNGFAHLTGMSSITDRCFIGPGAVIFNQVTVHRDVTIGANSVINRDITSGVTVVGVPGRILPNSLDNSERNY